MNHLLNRMERKFGKYAVPHLSAVMIGCYVIGYILQLINSNAASFMTLEPYYILQGQVWRLITWLIIPPSSLNLFTIIMLFFYFSVGTSLERAWGNFRYNVYIFGGEILTIIASFICYFVFSGIYGQAVQFSSGASSPFTTYYICMSIFLAFAATFPNAQVYLYFVIPLKVKWLGIIYGAFLVYEAVGYVRNIASGYAAGWIYLIAMIASLCNFVVFFLSTRDFRRFSPEQVKRRREFRKNMEAAQHSNKATGPSVSASAQKGPVPRHRCEVCGRTDITNPELEFRYCSKCKGSHEYCQDHLFTHEHIK